MTVREAAAAVRRGSTQEALVVLWNAVEPARLARDRSALAQIEGLAARIARDGDDAERREAERLVEAVRAAVQADGGETVTARLEGEVVPVDEAAGTPVEGPLDGEAPSRSSLSGLVWFLILLAIVLFNVLGQLRE